MREYKVANTVLNQLAVGEHVLMDHLLGDGGFGAVFSGHSDTASTPSLAMKQTSLRPLDQIQIARERRFYEDVAGRFDRKIGLACPKYFGYGVEPDAPDESQIVLMVEKVGCDLESHLDALDFCSNKKHMFVVISQAFKTMVKFHQTTGYVHRDVKLTNIALSRDGTHLVFLDFGSAIPRHRKVNRLELFEDNFSRVGLGRIAAGDIIADDLRHSHSLQIEDEKDEMVSYVDENGERTLETFGTVIFKSRNQLVPTTRRRHYTYSDDYESLLYSILRYFRGSSPFRAVSVEDFLPATSRPSVADENTQSEYPYYFVYTVTYCPRTDHPELSENSGFIFDSSNGFIRIAQDEAEEVSWSSSVENVLNLPRGHAFYAWYYEGERFVVTPFSDESKAMFIEHLRDYATRNHLLDVTDSVKLQIDLEVISPVVNDFDVYEREVGNIRAKLSPSDTVNCTFPTSDEDTEFLSAKLIMLLTQILEVWPNLHSRLLFQAALDVADRFEQIALSLNIHSHPFDLYREANADIELRLPSPIASPKHKPSKSSLAASTTLATTSPHRPHASAFSKSTLSVPDPHYLDRQLSGGVSKFYPAFSLKTGTRSIFLDRIHPGIRTYLYDCFFGLDASLLANGFIVFPPSMSPHHMEKIRSDSDIEPNCVNLNAEFELVNPVYSDHLGPLGWCGSKRNSVKTPSFKPIPSYSNNHRLDDIREETTPDLNPVQEPDSEELSFEMMALDEMDIYREQILGLQEKLETIFDGLSYALGENIFALHVKHVTNEEEENQTFPLHNTKLGKCLVNLDGTFRLDNTKLPPLLLKNIFGVFDEQDDNEDDDFYDDPSPLDTGPKLLRNGGYLRFPPFHPHAWVVEAAELDCVVLQAYFESTSNHRWAL